MLGLEWRLRGGWRGPPQWIRAASDSGRASSSDDRNRLGLGRRFVGNMSSGAITRDALAAGIAILSDVPILFTTSESARR